MAVQHWNIADGPFSESALRAKLESMGYRVARYVYEPGTVFPDHKHDVDKIDAVLSGRFRLVVRGHMKVLGPGEWIEIPRGTVHNAAVMGDEPVVSLDAVKIVKIAIFGSGGVGGYFGAKLAAAGEEVTFLARGAHLKAMQDGGLHVESPQGSFHLPKVQATDRPQAIGPVDVVLFTVKMYDVDASAATLAPLIGPDTVVITLQNGVEAMDMVAEACRRRARRRRRRLYRRRRRSTRPLASHHGAEPRLRRARRPPLRSSRRIRRSGQARRFRREGQHRRSRPICGSSSCASPTWSGMTAVTRSPMGVIRDDPALFGMMMTAIDEAIAVGTRARHHVPGRHCREHARDDSELSRHLEVVDARRSRARPAARAAVAERRRRPARQGGGRAGADPPVHHRGLDAVRQRPEVTRIRSGESRQILMAERRPIFAS